MTNVTQHQDCAWWIHYLTPRPVPVELPRSSPRSKVYSAKRASLRIDVDPKSNPELVAAWENSTSSFEQLFIAAAAAVLHRYSGEHQVAIGIPCSEDASNAGVLSLPVSSQDTLGTLVTRVTEQIADAEQHGGVPFEQIVEELELQGIKNCNPLFSVAVTADGRPTLSDLRNDVTVNVSGDELALRIDYSARLFTPGTVERFGQHLIRFAASAICHPEWTVEHVRYLSADEVRQIVEDANRGAAGESSPGTLQELVDRQAERTPTTDALIDVECRYSYARLREQSDRVARVLQTRGVAPETRVGLSLTRRQRLSWPCWASSSAERRWYHSTQLSLGIGSTSWLQTRT